MTLLPKAKSDNIVVQNLKDETLVYDLTTNKAFCLNATSAKVFNHCDGIQTFGDLKAEHQLTDEIIYLTLDELQKNNLLAEEYVSPFVGMNRREVIKKVGLASMIALPVISSLIAPPATAAASQTAPPPTSPPSSPVCARNVCIPAGQYPCGPNAECAGQTFTFTYYEIPNSGCTGRVIRTFTTTCNSLVIQGQADFYRA